MEELEKIDAIRERTGVTYRQARAALKKTDGDLVSALVHLEEGADGETWQQRIKVTGGDLVDKVESLIREGNVRRIIVRHQGRTLVEIPVTVGVIGAVLLPSLAALGAIAAMVSECTVVVQRQGDVEDGQFEPEDDGESQPADSPDFG